MSVALPWQAEDVLAVFAKFNLRPGSGVPVKTLWHSMGSGKDVNEGITHLVALKYVELNTSQTDVILTELGYRVLRGETPKAGLTPTSDPASFEPTPEPRWAVILTAIEVETRAVLRQLKDVQEETVKQTVFHVGRFEGWKIAVAECGPGNVRAASIAERAIDRFSPEVACFVGIAGGVKDVVIGDIVVATKVYGYESGKAGKNGFQPRPEISLPAHAFEQRARAIRLKDEWKARLDPGLKHDDAKIYVGAIAAGEKVVGSARSKTAQYLRATYGDTLAVEMEGRGFLDGVHINHPVQGCVVRGISDLLDNKEETDTLGSQLIGADAASAATFEMLATKEPAEAKRGLPNTVLRAPKPASFDINRGGRRPPEDFLLVFDEQQGLINGTDEELGIMCTEIIGHAQRGGNPTMAVEVTTQALVTAKLEALDSKQTLSVDERKERRDYDDIEHRYEQKKANITESVLFLLTSEQISKPYFGGRDYEAQGRALRRLVSNYTVMRQTRASALSIDVFRQLYT
jgi:nucleoside phosphorylase